MKKKYVTVKMKVSAKYKGDKGIKFKIGSYLVAVGTYLMSTKVDLYIDDTKIGTVKKQNKVV